MAARTYMGKVLIYVSLAEVHYEMCNVQKESLKKNFWGSHKFLKGHEKCVMKMEVEKII